MIKSMINDVLGIGLGKFLKKCLYFKWELYVYKGDLERYVGREVSPKVTLFPIDANNVENLKNFIEPLDHYGGQHEIVIQEYIKNKCEGYIGEVNKNIIGFVWFATRAMQPKFINTMMKFTWNEFQSIDADIMLYDIFISPVNRKGGNARYFSNNFLIDFTEKGYRNIIVFIVQNNRASIALAESFGFKKIITIPIKRFFCVFVLRGKVINFDLFKKHFWSDLIEEMNIQVGVFAAKKNQREKA